MDFAEFYNLTPAQRMAKNRTTAVRPFHPDWANQQMTNMVDAVRMNPWVVQTFGKDVDVSVNVSKDGFTLAVFLTRTGP